jgi:quinoprotein glucose dehydrogenase
MFHSWRRPASALGLACSVGLALACGAPEPPDLSGPVADWPHYGGDPGGLRYSPLTQINRENVGDLEIAWTYRHGDISDGSDGTTRTSFNATPVEADGTLYLCTGFNRVIAIDAETGSERWAFDPQQQLTKIRGPYPRVCRGVARWRDPEAAPGAACATRIFTGTLDAQLIALDAATGEPCQDFGSAGRVALREGVGAADPWEYYPTSPPLALLDVVVVGALVADNLRVDAPAGVVRAFDARSGALRWAWDPVPPGFAGRLRGEQAGEGFTRGTPNVWSILSADPARGLVFVPTGNASPDYFAAVRGGLDHYSSSTVAIDARSGETVWSFQAVHHDVWDYDVASQPTLFEFDGVESGPIPAVAQATKMGHVFLLDRTTGRPLFPPEERPVPQDPVPGEVLSPTQPFPGHVPPLHPATLTPDDAFGFTPWDRGRCRERIARHRSDGIFTPASLEGSIQYPGSAGGANWGGVSIDPETQTLYVNQTRFPMVATLIPRAEYDALPDKSAVYPNELYPMEGAPYALRREPLLSPLGAPCNPPPWGTLTAVDLRAGEVLWEVPLGTSRDQAPFPIWWLQGDVGSPNLGGSIVTAGGLVFIGATTDKYLRAFDAKTGELLWSHRLPFTANATPLSYRLRDDGRQFVVVAAGGHGWSEPGDAVVAFALP